MNMHKFSPAHAFTLCALDNTATLDIGQKTCVFIAAFYELIFQEIIFINDKGLVIINKKGCTDIRYLQKIVHRISAEKPRKLIKWIEYL